MVVSFWRRKWFAPDCLPVLANERAIRDVTGSALLGPKQGPITLAATSYATFWQRAPDLRDHIAH